MDAAGDFDVLEDEILSQDGLGIVYRGRERSSRRPVAVKVIRQAHLPSPDLAHRFRLTTALHSQIDDPCIARPIGTGVWKSLPYRAFEPPEAETVATLVARGARFTTDEILHLAEGVGRGLKALWSSHLVHGSLRSSSIYVAPAGAVKIADDGMAHSLNVSFDTALRDGEAQSWAPERAAGERATISSDLYSLGALLYELTTGKPPFDGYDSLVSLSYQILHVMPVPPRQLGSMIPPELDRLILSCLEKSPERRPATPVDFLRSIEAIRDALKATRSFAASIEDDLGDFDIFDDQVIGEGGMGTLFRGRQRSLNRPVAIKVMRLGGTPDSDLERRFRREGEVMAQVRDDHVVQVFGSGTWKGALFYAMELIEGSDLERLARSGRRFGDEEVIRLADGVGQALDAAWKVRVVHRDIKPANIMITKDGAVKVADFGLAKTLRINASRTQMIAGTAQYLSPEQGLGQFVDIRSDLYSLGVVLFELLAGSPPFGGGGGGDDIGTIYRHVHVPAPRLETIGVRAPQGLIDLIHRCLAKDPAERPQTPQLFLRDLRAIRGAGSGLSDAPIPTGDGPLDVRTAVDWDVEAARRTATADWAGAAEAFVAVGRLRERDLRREVAASLEFCREMERAKGLEDRREWTAALALYAEHSERADPFGAVARTGRDRVALRLLHAAASLTQAAPRTD